MKWFQVDTLATDDPRITEIWTRLMRACDGFPPTEWTRLVVFGVLLDVWCYIGRQDKARPGWGEYSDGRPIPPVVFAARLGIHQTVFEAIMQAAADSGHIDPEQWTTKQLIVLPAMISRADIYTKRRAHLDKLKPVKGLRRATKNKTTANSVRTNPDTDGSSVTVVVPVDVSVDQGDSKGDLDLQPPEPGSPDEGLNPAGLIKLWNEHRKPGPHILQSNPKLVGQLRRAIQATPHRDDWVVVIEWLNGELWANGPGTGDHPTWRAGLEWLSRPGKVSTYLERARLSANSGKLKGRDVRRGQPGVEPGKYAGLKDLE